MNTVFCFRTVYSLKFRRNQDRSSFVKGLQVQTRYFDPQKGRWRERGKEHLEEEKAALPPPPSMGKQVEKKEDSTKETSTLDNMMAPPNPCGSGFGVARKNTGVLPKVQIPLGESPPSDDAGVKIKTRGPPAASAAASEEFGAPITAPMNPFAPKAIAGGGSNQTRPQQRPKAKKRASPSATSPFPAPALLEDPEAGGGEKPLQGQGQESRAPTATEPKPPSCSLHAHSCVAQPEDANAEAPNLEGIAEPLPSSTADESHTDVEALPSTTADEAQSLPVATIALIFENLSYAPNWTRPKDELRALRPSWPRLKQSCKRPTAELIARRGSLQGCNTASPVTIEAVQKEPSS